MSVILHFVAEANRVPAGADHQISGQIQTGDVTFDRAVGDTIGHQDKKYVVVCNPLQRTDDVNRGSGEPWAVTCPKCKLHPLWIRKMQEFRDAHNGVDHPRLYTADGPEKTAGGCCG